MCVYVHEEVNAHLWSSTLTPSKQPSAWEVGLGDQCPSLRPREPRVSSVYLLVLCRNRSWTRWECFWFSSLTSVSWVMPLSIMLFLSSSSVCCSSSPAPSADLILDFPSSTFFFFPRARASPFAVFTMLEVLPLIFPSLPSRVTRLTSFFLYLTSSTRTTSEVVILLIHVHLLLLIAILAWTRKW